MPKYTENDPLYEVGKHSIQRFLNFTVAEAAKRYGTPEKKEGLKIDYNQCLEWADDILDDEAELIFTKEQLGVCYDAYSKLTIEEN